MRALLLKALLVVTMAIGLTPALGVTWAAACSCATASDKANAKNADAVFTGTLLRRDVPAQITSSADLATLTFAVSRVYKGDVAAEQQVTTAVSGASCGLEITGSGPFLVFAGREPATDSRSGSRTLGANLCGGTRPLDAKAVPASFGEGRAIAAEPISALGPTTDAEEEDETDNLAWLALAGGLFIVVGTIIATRRRRYP